jgi:hypothetical protein
MQEGGTVVEANDEGEARAAETTALPDNTQGASFQPSRLSLELSQLREAFAPLATSSGVIALVDAQLDWLHISNRIEEWRENRECLVCGLPSGPIEHRGEQGVLCAVCSLAYKTEADRWKDELSGALEGLARRRGRPKDAVADPEFVELYVRGRQVLSAKGKRPSLRRVLDFMNHQLPPKKQLTLRTLQDKLKRYGL